MTEDLKKRLTVSLEQLIAVLSDLPEAVNNEAAFPFYTPIGSY